MRMANHFRLHMMMSKPCIFRHGVCAKMMSRENKKENWDLGVCHRSAAKDDIFRGHVQGRLDLHSTVTVKLA